MQIIDRSYRWLRYVLLALLVLGGNRAEATKLKVCKQTCGPSIETSCAGLKKGKLKKCRKRIWKACKRSATGCVVPTTTTLALVPPTTTTATTATVTTTTVTTTTATTTSTTLPESFAGSWMFHGETLTDCGLPLSYDERIAIGVFDGEISAALDSVRDRVFAATKSAEGSLQISADALPTPPPNTCTIDLLLTLDGPVEPATQTTTGSIAFSIHCNTTACALTYIGDYQRLTETLDPSPGLGTLD